MENMDVFAVVVEQESINRASRLLNVSQPALSRKIMGLENELGIKLFERRGKRLELTGAGRLCYEYAVRIRDLEREFLQSVSRLKEDDTPSGLTIGASLTTLQSTLPDLIALFNNEHPYSDIKAITGKTHEIVTLVKDKKVDIGLVASAVDHPGIHCVPLFDDHLALVLPAGHLLTDVPAPSMADLNGLPMILFSKGNWYRVLMDDIFHRHMVLPNVKMEIDSFEAIIRLVSTCRTATLLPMSYLRSSLLENNELSIRRLPELEQMKRTTSLIFTEEAGRRFAIQSFVRKAKDFLDGPPPL